MNMWFVKYAEIMFVWPWLCNCVSDSEGSYIAQVSPINCFPCVLKCTGVHHSVTSVGFELSKVSLFL